MSAPQPDRGDGKSDNRKEAAVAKTAGFVVFSGIAMSIIKALTPNFKINDNSATATATAATATALTATTTTNDKNKKASTFCESTPPVQESKSKATTLQTIEIVKGDTLWGLSRKHGVSIDAIKEANGLTGDTIYAGKKLIIP